jgi:hypothetical protein
LSQFAHLLSHTFLFVRILNYLCCLIHQDLCAEMALGYRVFKWQWYSRLSVLNMWAYESQSKSKIDNYLRMFSCEIMSFWK